MLAGLSRLYENSDPFAVLMCRSYQLYHRDPLPTIAGFLFANLFLEFRTESSSYRLKDLINYVYDHVDSRTGKLILKSIKPNEMSDDEFLLYHLRTRCSLRGVEFLTEVFDGRETVPDIEFLPHLKEGLEIWIEDKVILDILEDNMTMEYAKVFLDKVNVIEISEYGLFNALAESYNLKILRDLSYLWEKIMAATSGENVVSIEVVREIFSNERERHILFGRL